MELFSCLQLNGWLGEKASKWGLAQGLDLDIYRPLHDVIIPNGHGGTTQIDHVILSRFGIFVIETKNRNGLIVGAPNQRNWQQIHNGRAFEFYNPLMQNDGHIRALARFLNLPLYAFHSIIFFIGSVQFAGPMPPNVRKEGVITVIHSKTNYFLTADEVVRAWDSLHDCKQHPDLSLPKHLTYIRSLSSRRHNSR